MKNNFGSNLLKSILAGALIDIIATVSLSTGYEIAKTKQFKKNLQKQNRNSIKKDRVCVSKLTKDEYCLNNQKLNAATNQKVVLFYEPISDRYFESTLCDVIYAEYLLNYDFCNRDNVLLNEWYQLLGLEPTIEGNELCWDVDAGYSWIHFDNRLSASNGRSYIRINIAYPPRYWSKGDMH